MTLVYFILVHNNPTNIIANLQIYIFYIQHKTNIRKPEQKRRATGYQGSLVGLRVLEVDGFQGEMFLHGC